MLKDTKETNDTFLFRYCGLIRYKAYVDLRAESERSYMGYLWWAIEPMIFMAIFYVVFGVLFNREKEDFVFFLLVGLVVWRWFQSTLMSGSNAILNGRGLMQQVYLHKAIFPTISILTNCFKFVVVFSLLLLFLWICGFGIGICYLALPLLFISQLLFLTAATYLFAGVVPFFPDIRIVLDNALRGLFFLSGLFFSIASIPEKYRFYLYLNPMATLIESYRDVLLYNQWPSWSAIVSIIAVSFVGIVLSFYLISRYDYVYPKLTS